MANLDKGTPITEVHQVMRAEMVYIDPDKKYLMHINFGPVPPQHRKRLLETFNERFAAWYASDIPVFTIHTFGQPLRIYKLDEEEDSE